MSRTPAFDLITWIGRFTAVLFVFGLISIYPSRQVTAAPLEANAYQAESPDCSLLDDAEIRGIMSGMFEEKMLNLCGRTSELGQEKPGQARTEELGQDKLVNNPYGDVGGPSYTQSETSLARSETNGVLCSAYNDRYHWYTQNIGITGFSSSSDGGANWVDRGAVPPGGPGGIDISWGDPALVWRKVDGHFYLATLTGWGLGLWDLGTQCATATYIDEFHTNLKDDKELMAVDNNPSSPYYGRMYVAWTNFTDGHIYLMYTNDTINWSTPLDVSLKGDVQGAWPAVDPVTNDVYIAWVHWDASPADTIDIEVVRSTNGGGSFSFVTYPASNVTNPRDAAATVYCERPALNGNIRYLPSPQIVVDHNGYLHVVYSYDSNGYNNGDVINVYYRRSTNHGSSWGTEIRLNNDTSGKDQFFPALTVNPSGMVAAFWYDRRLSNNNLYFDYYGAISTDNGISFQSNIRISDSSSPVILDSVGAKCYHGDYDTSASDGSNFYIQWADDRRGDADIYLDTIAIAPDFTLASIPDRLGVCQPDSGQFNLLLGSLWGFSEAVNLSVMGSPAGTTASFSLNPVTPPGSSILTIGNTAAAAPGNYSMDILGISASKRQSVRVWLDLFGSPPAKTSLLTPADGAANQALMPTLDWADQQLTSSYNFMLADNPQFDAPLISASGLATSIYVPATPLAENTCYWWRAQTENTCGGGGWSEPFHFSTMSVMNYFIDDLESGAGNWQHAAGPGVDQWTLTTALSHSPTHAWHHPDPTQTSDVRLWLATPVPIQVGSTLTFWHRYQFEVPNYDGAVLEISTDNGASWEDLGGNITANGYTDTIDPNFGNPLAGRPAWTAYLMTWTQVKVDLSSFAGQDVLIRWRLGSDYAVGDAGWFIDDVQITGPAAPSPLPGLASIQPATGDNRVRLDVVIMGTGFFGKPAVKLGSNWLANVNRVNSTTIYATVLTGMPLGVYDLVILNGDCQSAVLEDAFTVTGIGKMFLPLTLR